MSFNDEAVAEMMSRKIKGILKEKAETGMRIRLYLKVG
jgi:hypothetical protein